MRLLDKKTDAIIYVGIETDVEDRVCTSYKTGESLPDSHCYSGDVPSGFDLGGYIMSGMVSDSAKKEVFNILNSFNQ